LFIDVNYSKRPQKAKLHLAKPNKQIVTHIHEKFADNLALKLGNINELTFSIPHMIEDENANELIPNPHVESVKEKMLIRVKMGVYKEWFIIDSIEEDADDTDVFNVSAFSLGYELKGKRVSGFETESMNATEMANALLQGSVWKINEIDAMFDGMYRSFESGDDSNILDCIFQWAETFGGLLVWNTETKTISLKNMKEDGKFRGLTVDYGRFLKTVKRSRTTDEMVTRLYVYGSENLTIHSVNPTGQGYIEDFSFFMYPFERDVNKSVIQSSHFMSDALCHAILDHQALIQQNSPEIKNIGDSIGEKRASLIIEQSALDTLNLELENILQLLDVAQATEDTVLISQRKLERDNKQSEIAQKELVVSQLKSDIAVLESQLQTLQDEISNQANFTPTLLDELNPYIIEATWREDRHINVNELYDEALVKFQELREPKVVIEISMDNLMNIVEEQYYWDKLVLGDLIKVKYPQMNIEYMAKIIEINYDLENGEASLVIANTNDLLSETDKLVQLLYSSQSASALVQNNKYKWNKINAVSEHVSSILTNEWDANKNKIIAGVNNTIEVGNRGIIISNPDLPNEIVIMQAGIIALSKDGGETWKTAIKPDGIVAERLIGQIIAGQELLITNSSGSFTMDNNGAIFDVDSFIIRSGTGVNLVDKWQDSTSFVDEYRDDNLITAYEKKMLNIKWEEIARRYTANNSKLTNYYTDAGASLLFVTDYHARYDELYNYLFVTIHGEAPLLEPTNMTNTTRIVGSEFNTVFRNYDSARVELEKQLEIRAKALADQAIADVQEISETMDNMADDSLLDFRERQIIKDRLTDIIGYVIADTSTTLPTTATLDSGGKGNFYMYRKGALDAGIGSTDAKYVAVATQYNSLKTYLEALTPIDAWDLSDVNKSQTISVVKATFRDKWLQYYLAIEDLAESTTAKLKQNVDDVVVGHTNYAVNSDFSIDLNDSLWSSYYKGSTKEVVDISTEAPPHQLAYHVINTTNTFGGIHDPVIFDGKVAERLVNKEITVSFWAKYSNIVQGASSWNNGRFGEIAIEGVKADGVTVARSFSTTLSVTGSNTEWQKYSSTVKLTLPTDATKLTKIKFKHGLEGCTGEFWTTGIKIEMGNKVTDWSQSPYDLEAKTVNTVFKVEKDRIITTVTGSERFNLALGTGRDFMFNDGAKSWRVDHDRTSIPDLPTDPDASYGANSLKIQGTKYLYFGTPIPINTSNYYKVKFRVKQIVDSTDPLKSYVYAGVASYDVNMNKLTTTSFGAHRYVATEGSKKITVADGWQEFEGIITGEGDESFNQFIPNTRFAVPMFIVNYSGGDGTTLVDICSLEDITDLNIVGTRLTSVEESITDDEIVRKLTSSVTWENEMNKKADTEALGNLATKDELSQKEAELKGYTDDAVSSIDLSTYATQQDVIESSTELTRKFSATGGMNLLKNSLGFAGFEFWIPSSTSTTRLQTVSNNDLDTLGFGSGFYFPASDNSRYAYQEVPVVAGQDYTISWYINKTNNSPDTDATGAVVSDGAFWVQILETDPTDGVSTLYTVSEKYMPSYVTDSYESKFVTFKPKTNLVKFRIIGYKDAVVTITGIMFTIGDVALQWSLARGEVYNTNIRMDLKGIRVSRMSQENGVNVEVGYTEISPTEFAGFYDSNGDGNFEKVFYLNGDETVSKKIRALNEFTMGSIKIIYVKSTTINGWAFVPIVQE
jgi:phage minor structural protein